MKTEKILSTLICLLIVISGFAQVSVNITSNPPLSCKGYPVTLTANASGGVQPYTYLWSNNSTTSAVTVNPTVPYTYTVTVTDSNAVSNTAFKVVGIDSLTIDSISKTYIGDSIILTSFVHGGIPPYQYVWMPCNYISANPSIIIITPTTYTSFNLTVTDNYCVDEAIANIVSVSVNNIDENNNVSIFPNPANNFVFVEKNSFTPAKYFLSINNIQGQKVFAKNIQFNDLYKIDVRNLNDGMYFIALKNDEETRIYKLLVRH